MSATLPEIVIGALANMLVFGAILWGALKPSVGDTNRIWAVVLWPAAFNLLVCIFKSELDYPQRAVGLLVTATVVGAYSWIWRRGGLPLSPRSI